MNRILALLLLVVSTVGCALRHGGASPEAAAVFCAPPLAPYLRSTLYIDRSNTKDPLRPFSQEEWERFITEVLVRHLPSGGTVFDNTGWWRRPNGSTFRGIGRALVVLAPVGEQDRHQAQVKKVIEDVKTRYGHQLVTWEEARVCAAF